MRRSKKDSSNPKIDIHAVAERAKVSIATVSRTINHVPTVDPRLAVRVWKAVTDLKYFPNTQARALVSGKSRLLGLIVSEITNPFFPELIQEFEYAAVANSYEIIIGSTNYEAKTMERCACRMVERKVDGVAIMTFGVDEFLRETFRQESIPMVSIDAAAEAAPVNVLKVDYRAGIHEGVQHLAVLGHRAIAFVTGPLRLEAAEMRRKAFVDCMRSIGLKVNPEWVIEGDHTLEGGLGAMQKILSLPDLPTAIMCSNDMTAIGVQHALFEADLKVPDDFSLIGFDDVHLAEYTIPPLTTVRMSCRDLAQAAVKNLLAQISTDTPSAGTPDAAKISTRLIVRQTTSVPKGALVDLTRLEMP